MHFPACLNADDESVSITLTTSREPGGETNMKSRAIIEEIVNEEKISWAIWSNLQDRMTSDRQCCKRCVNTSYHGSWKSSGDASQRDTSKNIEKK